MTRRRRSGSTGGTRGTRGRPRSRSRCSPSGSTASPTTSGSTPRTFTGSAACCAWCRSAGACSCLVQFGETVVLAAVTVSDNVSTLPFFPLTVEYREKSYAAGKIPGGFLKREGRPSDEEILSARVIDRGVRLLFPEGFKNEVQVFVYVLSADQENDADVLGV